MRKWMRERLQRRKKTDTDPAAQPVPPPLQPAYFEAGESAAEPEPAPAEAKSRISRKAEVESEPAPEEHSAQAAPEPTSEISSSGRPSSAGQRGRPRRRRGGRGRSGRGREQAVAQAFSPGAIKGTIPSGQTEEEAPDSGESAAEEAIAGGAIPAQLTRPQVSQAPKVPAAMPATQRPPKGLVVLAIGLPGSGKSSWFKRHNVIPLSSDMVRSLLFDDIREQRFQDLVFSNLRSMLKARLIAKRPMNYVDATNLTPQERQHWIKLAKDYGYEVHAVFFDVPLEVCIERHQRRDRVVPEDVMRRMAAKLKPPAFTEGFAKITVVRVKKKD
jgi:predicted kinase